MSGSKPLEAPEVKEVVESVIGGDSAATTPGTPKAKPAPLKGFQHFQKVRNSVYSVCC